MTHPACLRERGPSARRDKRLAIAELAERLALPRTTIYHWLRDLPIRTWRPRGHGVMAVTANDTGFRARLQARIDRLRAEWA